MNGKGSARRKQDNAMQYRANYDAIFRKTNNSSNKSDKIKDVAKEKKA